MNCPCRQCNGLSELEVFFGNTQQEEPAEKLSLHERLGRLHDELMKAGVSADLVNELEELYEEVDRIDDKVIELQKQIEKKPRGSVQVELGELSKRLY